MGTCSNARVYVCQSLLHLTNPLRCRACESKINRQIKPPPPCAKGGGRGVRHPSPSPAPPSVAPSLPHHHEGPGTTVADRHRRGAPGTRKGRWGGGRDPPRFGGTSGVVKGFGCKGGSGWVSVSYRQWFAYLPSPCVSLAPPPKGYLRFLAPSISI